MMHNHAGQIVRIKLQNFMCYDDIELYPRNQLNLIIGPNGTGKSSIVCAVVLGLGGKLKALARADQLSSYVKTGCDQCSIEIELFEPKGQNVIVKRKILSNNQSEFLVNGRLSNATKVNEIRKNYSIQIDNLCTFLPQEKVQQFADLNPQQLLDQTQKTVGHGNLTQLHEELKKLQSRTDEQEKQNQLLENELEDEKQKNERLKDRVNSLREKQSLCEKLVTLNQKKAWLSYEEEVQAKDEVNHDYKLAEKDFMEKKRKIEKLNKALEHLENELSTHQRNLTEAKKDELGKKEAMEGWLKRANNETDELEDLRNILQIKQEEEEGKKRELVKYQQSVEKLTNDLETLDAKIGSEGDLRARKEEAEKELRAIRSKETELKQTRVDLVEDEGTLEQELRNALRESDTLKMRRKLRLDYLKRHEPDVYKSMEWLEKNRGLFRSRIYSPMLLELDVPDSKMAKYVEARLGYKDLISFTCTNADDLNLLIQKLRTEQRLKVNAICSDEDDESQYSPEIPIENLRRFGFYAYMKDLIEGPEDILRFLCRTYGIHRVPVGDEMVKTNCEEIPRSIRIFYSENDAFFVKYSAYSKQKSITAKQLQQPRFFAESLDEKRSQDLQQRAIDLRCRIMEKRKEVEEVDNQLRGLGEVLERVKEAKKELGTTAEKRQQIQMNLSRAKNGYKSIEETLKDPVEIEREARQQRQALQKKIAKNLEELKTANEDWEKSREKYQTCEIVYRVNRFGKKQILESKECCMEELSRKEGILREMKERHRVAEFKCEELKEKAKQLTENISKEERDFKKFQDKFAKLPNSLEDIEAAIEETQTMADFLGGGNYEVLREYEKREEKIAQLSSRLEDLRTDLEARKLDLARRRERWLTPMEELVSKINDNFGGFFESMNCAGEVSLVCGEDKADLSGYGIKIRVKFRDGVPLQDLGGKFQSGGERAVATAIFILSLQELTSVPFRFVDEINQGMDPENERRILQLLIRVTDSQESTQYFFITPKLLPDVKCSRLTTVHCIHKGANAIPAAQWNLRKFLGERDQSEEGENS